MNIHAIRHAMFKRAGASAAPYISAYGKNRRWQYSAPRLPVPPQPKENANSISAAPGLPGKPELWPTLKAQGANQAVQNTSSVAQPKGPGASPASPAPIRPFTTEFNETRPFVSAGNQPAGRATSSSAGVVPSPPAAPDSPVQAPVQQAPANGNGVAGSLTYNGYYKGLSGIPQAMVTWSGRGPDNNQPFNEELTLKGQEPTKYGFTLKSVDPEKMIVSYQGKDYTINRNGQQALPFQ